jgi:succinate dehydrogenase/fumarate reductase flavoprotein subunit
LRVALVEKGATGRYAGRKAAAYAKEIAQGKILRGQIEKEKTRVYAPVKRDSGLEWKELHAGIARVMQYYCSEYKTKNLFNIGLGALEKIEKESVPMLYALDPHNFMRTLEDLTMLEYAKLIIQASKARMASSKALNFQRIDFPENDPPEWNKFLTMRLENDKIVFGEKPQKFWGNMKEQYEAHNRDYKGIYNRE